MDCCKTTLEKKSCTSVLHQHCCMPGCGSNVKDKQFCLSCTDALEGSFISNGNPVPLVFPKFDVDDLSEMIHVTETDTLCENFISCTNAICPSFHCPVYGCARAICSVCMKIEGGHDALKTCRTDDIEKYQTFRCKFHCIHNGHREAYIASEAPTNNSKCDPLNPLSHCSNFAHKHCADICLSGNDHKSLFCRSCCGESGDGHCIVNHCDLNEDCELHGIVQSRGNLFGFGRNLKKNVSMSHMFSLKMIRGDIDFKTIFLLINFVNGYTVPVLAFLVMLRLGFMPDENLFNIMYEICSLTMQEANVHQLRIKFLMDMFVAKTESLTYKESNWAMYFNCLVVYFSAKYSPNPNLVIKGTYPPKYSTQEIEPIVMGPPIRTDFNFDNLRDLLTSNAYSIDYKIANASIGEMSIGQVLIHARGARFMNGMDYAVPSTARQITQLMTNSTSRERHEETVHEKTPSVSTKVSIPNKYVFYSTFNPILSMIGIKLSRPSSSEDDYEKPLLIPLLLLTNSDITWDDFITENHEQILAMYGPKGVAEGDD